MGEIVIDFTSDWHVGHPQAGQEYPAKEDIEASLQRALDRQVDAYVVAGDFIDRGNEHSAHEVASIIKPYTDKGLRILGVVGNHDEINGSFETARSLFRNAGVVMLEGEESVVTSKTGDKQVSILGVSGEIGHRELDDWWRSEPYDMVAYNKAHDMALGHRNTLKKGLENAASDTVVVVSHRSIVSATIGERAVAENLISAQTRGFAEIMDRHATRRHIIGVSGHDHDVYPWDGAPYGQTEAGVKTYNVAAPMRRSRGMPMTQTLMF